MLALRSILVIDALDTAALAAARTTAADAVLIDLAHPALHGRRTEARTSARRAAQAIAKAGRPVIARVSSTVTVEMEPDLDAVIGGWLTAVMLADTEQPQDARDADVQIRKREMRAHLTPGSIRLIAEVESSEALALLPQILRAVDRFGAVALSVDGLREDLRLGSRALALYDHAMADVAIAAHTARLPWIANVEHHRPEFAALPARAHDFGAAGVTVHHEASARGMNSLFAPDPTEVAIARAIVTEWTAVRRRGGWSGVVAGEVLESPVTDRSVDRRSVRRARALLDQVEAIEACERAE
ncbi:MAG: aldolase/citrate lyase family protein [Chloroflexi bacterium]|nr:aldolase/citrate lyase family protein [Chloroflexota bacterium]MDA1239516.1 aldolase/citrate lyase family protein [Chloroflexota bacterium]MQC25726.1 hypothetical protein [Chloroflexota bacterium]MQC47599.1 hypothetical protein [Chloroflexota bacterium]